MKEKDKAWEIMEKLNGQKISYIQWASSSVYARENLQRKATIVVDEVLKALDNESNSFNYWNEVKNYIQSF